ncbi:MAG: hypothetical protein ACRDRL_30100 [Sciscionella sp.]
MLDTLTVTTRQINTPHRRWAVVCTLNDGSRPPRRHPERRSTNGEKGAILRREGLYSSHVIEWTRARDAGVLTGQPADPATPSKRTKKSAEQVELEKLRRRNAKLESDLATTRIALDIMGKAHAFLEGLSESAENDEPPRTS